MINDTNPTPQTSLTAAPGAELSFDELFPLDGENIGAPQVPQGTVPSAPPVTPAPVAAPPAPEFFIKAGSTVYKSQEDAVKGIEHKDTLIGRYREYLQTKGINPDTLQSAQPEPQVPAVDQSPYTYLNNGKKLHADLADAMSKGDTNRWEEILRKHNEEQMQATYAPIAPYITEMARMRAVREVGTEVPNFGTFVDSDEYKQTLDNLPRLKQAIETAQSNFQMADSLGELYKIAYLATQGSRPAAPVVTAAPAAAPVVQTQPMRPTMAASTMVPPQPTSPADLTTQAGRQQYLKDVELRGIKDVRF